MPSFLNKLTSWVTKSAQPDWSVLERYLAWSFGGGASASGIVVNPQTAMQSASVYACLKVLSESIAMLPIYVFNVKGDVKTKAINHPLWEILRHQPNEWQTIAEFMELMIMSLALRGNAYAFVVRTSDGRVVELLPLQPDIVRPEMLAGFNMVYHVTTENGGTKTYTSNEILHVRGLTLNGWLGISPIAYARESIGLALATEKFGGQLFRNGAKMGGVLEHPAKMTKEAYDRLKLSFDAASSGENAHTTSILEEGMKFTKIAMSSEDAQFLETRKYQRSEIAAIFRVPPHMIGDLERATFSNIEQQSLEFVQYSLMPYLNRIEQAFRRDLFSPQDRKNLLVKFNVAGLLRGDASARATYYNSGIMAGWMTRNEAREAESDVGVILNPLEGLDIPLMPLNMTDGTDDPDEAQDEAETIPTKESMQ